MKRSKHFLLTFIFAVVSFYISPINSYGQDISFEVTSDRAKVSLGSGLQLNLILNGIQDFNTLDLPDSKSYEWKYLGPSTQMSIINGKVSSSITHTYLLIPLKAGVLGFPPMTIIYKGKEYTSDKLNIEVIDGPLRGTSKRSMSDNLNLDAELKDKIFAVLEVDKTEMYINEIVPVTIKLYVDRLPLKNIQYPKISRKGISLKEFSQVKQYREYLGGKLYDIIEFNTSIFGMRKGEFILGPAEIKGSLVVKKRSSSRRRSFDDMDSFFNSDFFSGGFFGNYQRYPIAIKTKELSITISPLPNDKKPKSFEGAIGDYEFDLLVSPKLVKVGDPITLKMIISGKGNFDTVNVPVLNFGKEFKVYDPEIKQSDRSKIFEQVIIPKNSKIKEIPKIEFSFFDIDNQEYKTLIKGPVNIEVKDVEKGEELKIFDSSQGFSLETVKKEVLGKDIIYIKENLGYLSKRGDYFFKNKLFLLFQIFILIGAVVFSLVQGRREKLKTDIRYARNFRAPRKAKIGIKKAEDLLTVKDALLFYNCVFKTLQEYLGDRFHIPTGGITTAIVDDLLKTKEISADILNKLRDIFDDCDVARYAPSELIADRMSQTLKNLKEAIDYLQRRKV